MKANEYGEYVFRCRKANGDGTTCVVKGRGNSPRAIVKWVELMDGRYADPDEIHIYKLDAYKRHEERLNSVCLLGIKRVIEEYAKWSGRDAVSDSAEAEVKLLEEIFAERLRKVRKVCHANEGIACDYALAKDGYDVCSATHDCPFCREEVK